MKIAIHISQAINHIGGRGNNEDSIYPPIGNVSKNDKLFLVCDGVGGNEKGEVASRLVCDKIPEYFLQNPINEVGNKYVSEAINYAEDAFDEYIKQNPESKGMATTLTLLSVNENGVTIAHIGDSRVYQFRNGEIIYQTEDHSLVNEMVKGGIITEEQARDHSKKNVINRSIQGKTIKPADADVAIIQDLQSEDYFFMCTDGILENITDFEIARILEQNIDNEAKIRLILSRCEENPKDNFSAYLIKIQNVEGIPIARTENEPIEGQIEEITGEIIGEPETAKGSFLTKLRKIFPLILVIAGLFFIYHKFSGEKKPDNSNKLPNNKEAIETPAANNLTTKVKATNKEDKKTAKDSASDGAKINEE